MGHTPEAPADALLAISRGRAPTLLGRPVVGAGPAALAVQGAAAPRTTPRRRCPGADGIRSRGTSGSGAGCGPPAKAGVYRGKPPAEAGRATLFVVHADLAGAIRLHLWGREQPPREASQRKTPASAGGGKRPRHRPRFSVGALPGTRAIFWVWAEPASAANPVSPGATTPGGGTGGGSPLYKPGPQDRLPVAGQPRGQSSCPTMESREERKAGARTAAPLRGHLRVGWVVQKVPATGPRWVTLRGARGAGAVAEEPRQMPGLELRRPLRGYFHE
jgi:hypothetical protein